MIRESELLVNGDGTIFHLHLKPENLAGKIILVGDPGRVETVSGFFETLEFTIQSREFCTATGIYRNNRVTVLSTGIGTDNIDIVLNELDALANIDFKTREAKSPLRKLQIVRIGTSGSLQSDVPVNSFVVSKKSIGFDGMLNYYANRESISDLDFEQAFKNSTKWNKSFPTPYVVDASESLFRKFGTKEFIPGVTISAPGFYGPQGRVLRLPLADPELNQKITDFSFNGDRITNYEMESSAIYGLSKLLGHEALTVCLIIANRVTGDANPDYHPQMGNLIRNVLDVLTEK